MANGNRAIPGQIGRAVRIGTGEVGVPAAGDTVAAVLPIEVPVIDCSAGIIFDSDAGDKACIPFVVDGIGARCECVKGECNEAGAQAK